jgi:colanic acid/amylovoran biosynthesis glycosyltransferase
MPLNLSPIGCSTPRLAFVTGGLAFGGSTTFLCNIGGELIRQKVPVLILSLEKLNAFSSDFSRLGVKVVTQDDQRNIFEDRVRGTLTALSEFKPTAVISCLGAHSYEILRYVPHGIARGAMIQADAKGFYDGARIYGQFVDAIIGVSPEIQRSVSTMPEFRHARHLFLPYGVPIPDKWTPRRLQPGAPLRFLYLGRLLRGQKRVHIFPEILKDLTQSGIPFVWTIIGDGPEFRFLQETLKPNRPAQEVRVLPGVPNEAVPEIMAQNDVFLLASDCEGLPLSLLEAMAGGLVPVISDLESGVRTIVENDAGIRVRTDDIKGYAAALIRLYNDPATLEQFSRNARLKVEKEYSTRAMTDRWLLAFPGSDASGQWPSPSRFKVPLGFNPLHFSPPLRPLRRLALRLRSRFGYSAQQVL